MVAVGLELVPVVGGALSTLAQAALERRRARVSEAGGIALDTVDDVDLFVQRVRDDERLADWLVRVSDAASRTTMRAKRRALGRALGRAVKDAARVDLEELFVAALEDLDVIHVRALAHMISVEDGIDWDTDQGIAEVAFESSELIASWPAPVRATLERHGCIDVNPPRQERTGWSTDFGRALIDYLRDDGWTDEHEDAP